MIGPGGHLFVSTGNGAATTGRRDLIDSVLKLRLHADRRLRPCIVVQ